MSRLAEDARTILEGALGSRARAERILSEWGAEWSGFGGSRERGEEDGSREQRRGFENPKGYMRGHVRGARDRMAEFYGTAEAPSEAKTWVEKIFQEDVAMYARIRRDAGGKGSG
jgi:hypothetical protein